MADADGLSPVVQRRRLRTELRKARQEAQFTQEQVAVEMDWSLSKVIRIENGSVNISTNDLKALLRLYELTDDNRTEELVALARASRERAWWSGYREVAPASLLQLIGYETAASVRREFETLLIPGILQTEEYARTTIREFVEGPAKHLDTLVELRMKRQELLERADPPTLFFVLDEAVVRRQIGGKAVMRHQILRLIEVADRPKVTVEVVPFAAGAHPGLKGPFVVIGFPDPEDDDVLYQESAQGDLVSRDLPEQLPVYREAFEVLRKLSLGPEGSVAFLALLAEEMA
ncbi:MAG TPA: helix-turn-helix transcriptional regulator [Streptosporangiaceae bacterium]|nr:helix-turn-helix transcriptional regulator [Streptosporangiaceae bacterium]